MMRTALLMILALAAPAIASNLFAKVKNVHETVAQVAKATVEDLENNNCEDALFQSKKGIEALNAELAKLPSQDQIQEPKAVTGWLTATVNAVLAKVTLAAVEAHCTTKMDSPAFVEGLEKSLIEDLEKVQNTAEAQARGENELADEAGSITAGMTKCFTEGTCNMQDMPAQLAHLKEKLPTKTFSYIKATEEMTGAKMDADKGMFEKMQSLAQDMGMNAGKIDMEKILKTMDPIVKEVLAKTFEKLSAAVEGKHMDANAIFEKMQEREQDAAKKNAEAMATMTETMNKVQEAMQSGDKLDMEKLIDILPGGDKAQMKEMMKGMMQNFEQEMTKMESMATEEVDSEVEAVEAAALRTPKKAKNAQAQAMPNTPQFNMQDINKVLESPELAALMAKYDMEDKEQLLKQTNAFFQQMPQQAIMAAQ